MNQCNTFYFGMHFIWWIIIGVILIILVFARSYNSPYQGTRKDNPLDILKERYAKGEITKEEFEEAKKVLNNSH